MNFYYDIFVPLCNAVGKSPSKVALELNCSKSMVTNWKKRGTWPTSANLAKIEDYFCVKIDAESGTIKKAATREGDGKDLEDLIRLYRSAPAWLQDQARSLLEAGVQSVGNRPDSDSKD